MARLLSIPAVPGSLRQMNRLAILQLLRAEGPISKADLAKRSAISRPTVSKVVDDLHTDGLAEIVGTATPSAMGGKPAKLYRFHSGAVRVGAVLLSVDGVSLAICDGDAHILSKVYQRFSADRSPSTITSTIISMLSKLLCDCSLSSDDLLGIGVGVPGLTDSTNGMVSFAPHLPGWNDVPLSRWLADAFDVPIWLDNDCHLQALAERYRGQGADCDTLICVETGVGLAAAFLFNGQLYRGPGNTAGEVGHMTIQEDGPLCECGNRGCWESLASTTWLANKARQTAQNGRHSIIPIVEEVEAQAEAVYQAARAGDALALELVSAQGHHFGVGIANLVNAFNPQRIILHGESLAGGPPFLQAVVEAVQERALLRPRQMVEIVFSDLGDDVGLIGATSLVMETLFSMPAILEISVNTRLPRRSSTT
ncbi:MAG TPA: ROK family transcriptional regulator [Ktedonobacterales bacterium]|nr:ROK family transcriptional regulator [Ktedonobacterales bacterium]